MVPYETPQVTIGSARTPYPTPRWATLATKRRSEEAAQTRAHGRPENRPHVAPSKQSWARRSGPWAVHGRPPGSADPGAHDRHCALRLDAQSPEQLRAARGGGGRYEHRSGRGRAKCATAAARANDETVDADARCRRVWPRALPAQRACAR
jgi:hypothetical protein